MKCKHSSRPPSSKCFTGEPNLLCVYFFKFKSSTIHHAYERTGPVLAQPSIHLPPPAIPSYLTASTSSGATMTNRLPVVTAPAVAPGRRSRAHSTAPTKPKVDLEVVKQCSKVLQQEVIDAAAGSSEAHQLFNNLPDRIAEIHPKVKDQEKFVSDLCKTVWFKHQGEVTIET